MASHVTVIATDLRRTTIKVTPGTYMTDVLQEACKKLALPGDKYLFKNKQKNVDLSIPWRQTGLSPGAKLELVQKSKTPSAVSVALQLPSPEAAAAPPQGRLVDKLASDTTLWKVLRQFESGAEASRGKNFNFTARGIAQTSGNNSGSGQLYYETPVLNIMGRELATFADFQKTLSQLGYNSGSVLIRLAFRKTDKTLFAAMEEIGQFFAEAEAEEAQAAKEKATEPAAAAPTEEPTAAEDSKPETTTAEPEQAPREDAAQPQEAPQDAAVPQPEPRGNDAMDVDQQPSDPLQPVGIFQAPTGTAPAAALAPVNESDFTPSVAHAQLHQARLQTESQNKRLLSDQELEQRARAEEARLSSVANVTVKVRFPDNTSAQWSFGPAATGASLHRGVRSVMANEGSKFRLVVPGVGTKHVVVADDDGPGHRLIHDYKLTRSVLLNLVWDDGVPVAERRKPFLKGSVAQKATAVKVPDVPQTEKESDAGSAAAAQASSKRESGDRGEGVAKKLPKWLKLPGKK